MIAKRLHRSERGDTIVEVLIAIAVVSTILGITYSSMNRGLAGMRDAQERSEALKLIQGQIEGLRYANGAAGLSVPSAGSPAFCLSISGNVPSVVNFTNNGFPTSNLSADDFGQYPSGSNQCVQRFYHIAIKHESAKMFRFYVRWDKVGGRTAGDRNQIEMVYRTQ